VDSSAPPPRRRAAWRIAALIGVLASVVAVWFAWLAHAFLCDENCSSRSWELSAQLWIAIVGLVLTVSMAYLVFRDRPAAAKVVLAVVIGMYALWAVVLDAATHGWGHGAVPF
jgi:cyanate permease